VKNLLEYAFTREPVEITNRINAVQILKQLQQQLDCVTSFSIATHTRPWILFVGVTRELSDAEKSVIQQFVDSLTF
jgi:hypothetical protein